MSPLIFPTPRRVFPFGPVKGVDGVTDHCLDRFRERANVAGTFGEVIVHLEKWLDKAQPAELKRGKIAKKILAHGHKPASYWLMGNPGKGCGFILVVVGTHLVTVHRNESGEWQLPATGKKQ